VYRPVSHYRLKLILINQLAIEGIRLIDQMFLTVIGRDIMITHERLLKRYLSGVLAMLCSTIDNFEVSAGDAVSSCWPSTAVTVWTAWTTDVTGSIVEIIRRTVGHALVVLAQVHTRGAERQSRTIAFTTLGVTFHTALTTHHQWSYRYQ